MSWAATWCASSRGFRSTCFARPSLAPRRRRKSLRSGEESPSYAVTMSILKGVLGVRVV